MNKSEGTCLEANSAARVFPDGSKGKTPDSTLGTNNARASMGTTQKPLKEKPALGLVLCRARTQFANPNRAATSARSRAALAVAYEVCMCPRNKNKGTAATPSRAPDKPSSHWKYLVQRGTNCVSARATSMPTGASAGKM